MSASDERRLARVGLADDGDDGDAVRALAAMLEAAELAVVDLHAGLVGGVADDLVRHAVVLGELAQHGAGDAAVDGLGLDGLDSTTRGVDLRFSLMRVPSSMSSRMHSTTLPAGKTRRLLGQRR